MAQGVLPRALAGLGAAATAVAAWALLIEPRRTRVRRLTLELAGWPPGLDGLRVVALSDLHAGAPQVGADRVADLVERVNAERPDLITLLGDFVDHEVLGGETVTPEAVAGRLAGLRARLGVFAVLGNHDWDFGGHRVARALAAQGIAVLEDDPVRVTDELWLVGLADPARGARITTTMAGVPEGAATIVLTHHPDLFPGIPERVALTLAGHTHGGQVNLPFLRHRWVPSRHGDRYAGGLVESGDRKMYVSRGVGTSRLPVRLGAPPEIVVLELHG